MNENQLEEIIMKSCQKVHETLGPGFDPQIYVNAMLIELETRKIPREAKVKIPLVYKGATLEMELYADIIVDKKVVLQIKAQPPCLSEQRKDIFSCVKLSGLKLGLLVNFRELDLGKGLIRIENP